MSVQPQVISPDGLEHRLPYRPAFDGLRAFAVGAVVLFHAGWSRAHGGFLGVDVFFTLSGYLITTLLLTEHQQTGRIRLVSFWLRRARRLMPAQIVMAFIVVVAAWLSTPPGYFGQLTLDALSAIFYFGNWHLVQHTTSYFATGAAPSLFTHSWSLAIEEQFYLLWPLVAVVALRRRVGAKTLGYIAFGGALVSYILTQILMNSASTNRLYYGTDTHALGILAGAALATWMWRRTFSSPQWSRIHVLGYVGVGALAVTMYLARGSSEWVFRFGFVAVALSVCMVITSLTAPTETILSRTLSWRPLTYVGRLSYGIYLWHYPVIALLTHRTTHLTDLPLFLVRLLATLLVAAASYHGVELPLRRAMTSRTHALRFIAAGVLVLCAVVVVATHAERTPTYASPLPTQTSDPVRALILGDSVMLTLDHTTAPWRDHNNVTSASMTVLGCGIGPSFRPIFHGHLIFGNAKCHLHGDGSWPLETLWRDAIASQRPDVVIVGAGRWETHDHLIGSDRHSIDDPWFRAEMTRGLSDIWDASQRTGSALLLLTTPCAQSGETLSGHRWPEDAPYRVRLYNTFVRQFAATHNNTSVLDLYSWACPNGQFSLFDSSGRFMIRNADGVHFGPGAGPLFGTRLWSAIRHVGEQSASWQTRHP